MAEDEPRDSWSLLVQEALTDISIPSRTVLCLGPGFPELVSALQQHTIYPAVGAQVQIRHAKQRSLLDYAYMEIRDIDQGDMLAYIELHSISEPAVDKAPLIAQLLDQPQHKASDTMVLFLLDWTTPWSWIDHVDACVKTMLAVQDLLNTTLHTRVSLAENMSAWQVRLRSFTDEKPNVWSTTDADRAMVAATERYDDGIFDLPLGFAVGTLLLNAQSTSALAATWGFRSHQFDFMIQTLRSVLLHHGSSVLSMTFPPSHSHAEGFVLHVVSSLGLGDVLGGVTLPRTELLDLQKISITAGWDSLNKIKMYNESFDPEGREGRASHHC